MSLNIILKLFLSSLFSFKGFSSGAAVAEIECASFFILNQTYFTLRGSSRSFKESPTECQMNRLLEVVSMFSFLKTFVPRLLDVVSTGSILLVKNDLERAGLTSGASQPRENP